MRLPIDDDAPTRCRALASAIVEPVLHFIAAHSTLAVERAVARLLGVGGTLYGDIPTANVLIDELPPPLLACGSATAIAAALVSGAANLDEAVSMLIAGQISLTQANAIPRSTLAQALDPYVKQAVNRIDSRRLERSALLERLPQSKPPLLYVIVASGNIYEDRTAAVAAAQAGAQIIAVIRSTGQSLLDFVPEGATTEGFGGTYATQENFRIMRAALDEVSERLGRYVMLTNYASGLCMPEIAALAAIERLDMLLNDSMYGILFRDINMKRTFIDQHFSRRLNARSGIIINTGEDNYLTTADAIEQAPIVLASQFINEAFAHAGGLPDKQIGLGDAYEIDPALENSFLYQLAQAQLTRQIFPDSPLKYMPPTKHMTGDIFRGHLIDAMFNLTSVMTKQTIHLCGMLTEAIHTPFLGDRALALENARYIMNTAREFGEEIIMKEDGIIARRARLVLSEAEGALKQIANEGLVRAIERGLFADVKRKADGGRGVDGVFARSAQYWNPFEEALQSDGAS